MSEVYRYKRKRNEHGKKVRKQYEKGQTQERLKDMRDWNLVPQDVMDTVTGVWLDLMIQEKIIVHNSQPRNPSDRPSLKHSSEGYSQHGTVLGDAGVMTTLNTSMGYQIEINSQTQESPPPSQQQMELIPLKGESTLSLSDSLARICQLLANEEASNLHEAAYSLRQCESLGMRNPIILSLKMSQGCFPVVKEGTLRMYLEQSPTLGTMVNGRFLILGGFCPKTESGYTLSDILETDVDPKYFLSERQVSSLYKGQMKPQILEHCAEEDTQEDTIME